MIEQKNLELVISPSTTPSAAGKIPPPGPLSEKKQMKQHMKRNKKETRRS